VRLYTEPEMVKAAVAIVHGRVAKVQPRLESSGWVVTDVTLEVTAMLKGQKQSTVVLTQMGGTFGGMTTRVPGTSVYTPGEEVVVFLEQGGNGTLCEMGVGAGKFVVTRQGGQVLVQRRLGGVAFARVGAGGRAATPVEPPKVQGPEALDAFIARLQTYQER
jgi:hypothetical protein